MKKCIVIDREYGSGGREVAHLISQRTGMEFYDGERLVQAAERYGIDVSLFRDNDEKGVGSFLSDLTRYLSRSSADSTADDPFKAYESRARLFRALAAEKPCVFLGRCAAEALEGTVRPLSVFVYSTDLDAKMKRAKEVDGVPADGIASYIAKRDDQRSRYYHYFTGKDWGRKTNYDLCLNTAVLGYERTADAILACV